MQLLAWEVSGDTGPLGIVSLLMLTVTYAVTLHTQGKFNSHTVHNLYRIMGTAVNVMGVSKMGNNAPRAGIKPTSLAFWASVLTLSPPRLADVTPLPTPTCLFSSLPERPLQ